MVFVAAIFLRMKNKFLLIVLAITVFNSNALFANDIVDPTICPPSDVESEQWIFSGSVGEIGLHFEGASVKDLWLNCKNRLHYYEVYSFSNIKVRGVSYPIVDPSIDSFFWDFNDVCALAALNSAPHKPQRLRVSGHFEAIPFDVVGNSKVEMQKRVERFWSRGFFELRNVQNVTIGTEKFSPTKGQRIRWNADTAKAIVIANIFDPQERYFSQGTVEGAPYALSGNTRDEIFEQCLPFAVSVKGPTGITEIVINGSRSVNPQSSYDWTASQACRSVMAGALDTQAH